MKNLLLCFFILFLLILLAYALLYERKIPCDDPRSACDVVLDAPTLRKYRATKTITEFTCDTPLEVVRQYAEEHPEEAVGRLPCF